MINYIYQLIAPRAISVKYEDINFLDKVIVKPTYMAICHADQRYYTGQRNQQVLSKKLPMALIHECCGTVVHDPTGTFPSGEPVVLIPNVPGKPDEIIMENYATDAGFLSSGCDGFLREYVDLRADRLVSHRGISAQLAAVTEFVSVASHTVGRFSACAHEQKDRITVWGDGSLSFVVANVLRQKFPASEIVVIGKNARKLAYFSFVDQAFLAEDMPASFTTDHAFECCGGEGSYYALDDIIRTIKPQGTVMLMGVSENKVAINTRDVLEKGLTLIGNSRSGKKDFEEAIQLMRSNKFQNRLELILYEDEAVNTIEGIHRVFQTDLGTPFKTIFEWKL